MHHHGETDVAHLLRHFFADALPGIGRPVEPVNAAMVLLIQPVRIARAQPDAVWIVKGGVGRIESHDHIESLDQRVPGFPAIGRFVHAAAGHGEVQVRRVARVDDDRMQFRSVRCAVLHAAHPFTVLRIVVDAGKRRPRRAAVFRAEESLRRGAGVPHARLVRQAGLQPEGVIDRASLLPFFRLGECGRLLYLLPLFAEIGGAVKRGAEVSGRGGGEEGFAIAGIEHQMVDDMAEEVRTVRSPGFALGVAVKNPRALARSHQNQQLFRCCRFALYCFHS